MTFFWGLFFVCSLLYWLPLSGALQNIVDPCFSDPLICSSFHTCQPVSRPSLEGCTRPKAGSRDVVLCSGRAPLPLTRRFQCFLQWVSNHVVSLCCQQWHHIRERAHCQLQCALEVAMWPSTYHDAIAGASVACQPINDMEQEVVNAAFHSFTLAIWWGHCKQVASMRLSTLGLATSALSQSC